MQARSTKARGIKPSQFREKMPIWALVAVLAALGCATTMPARAQAVADNASAAIGTGSAALPGELRAELPTGRLSGTAKLTFWGLDIYNASLWVTPAFEASRYAQHPFALQLTYLRSLDGAAIAKRSIDEMLRQTKFTAQQAQAWQAAMAAIFPDVKSGDRITGIHKPGAGASFLVNGKPKGDILDPEFARLFFGIWLSDATSEPAMRKALLTQAPA